MTLPTGAPSAVTSKKTLTVAIVSWMGWIRVDSEARARAWSCWRAGAEWSRQSGLASSSNVQLGPPSKLELKSRRLEGWSEEAGAEQSSRSGAQGGARMLSWKIHTRKTFAVEQCIRYKVSTKDRLSPLVAKPKHLFCWKIVWELFWRITTWLHQWKQSTLLWPAYPRRLLERSQILGNDNIQQFFQVMQVEKYNKSLVEKSFFL